MEYSLLKKHQQKVNLISSKCLWILVAIHLLYAILFRSSIDNIIRAIVVTIFTLLFKLFKNNSKLKNLLHILPTLTMFTLATLYPTHLEMTIFCLVGGFIAAGMYFDSTLFKYVVVFGNVFGIICILGLNMELIIELNLLISVNITAFCMYFLSKWGENLIDASYKDALYNKDLVDKLEHTFSVINNTSISLDSNITDNNVNISQITDISSNLNNIITDVAKGATYQAQTISDINNMMEHIKTSIEDAYDVSSNTFNLSRESRCIIVDSTSYIDDLNKHATIMQEAIDSSTKRVELLVEQIKIAITYLSNIKNLSTQTNLLALNASIEAARAGTVGKGFAIVASEIKNLAMDSSNIATDVDEILKQINSTIELVSSEIIEIRNVSVLEQASTSSVTNAFDSINESFQNIDYNIDKNLSAVENIKTICLNTLEGLDNILTISSKNSNLVQQTLGITQTQSRAIEDITNSTSHIQKLNDSLRTLVSSDITSI